MCIRDRVRINDASGADWSAPRTPGTPFRWNDVKPKLANATTGLSRANRQGLRGLRIGGLRIGARELAISKPRTPSSPAFVGR
eukprot:1656943-Alexandrium_andersonii.AAC.1